MYLLPYLSVVFLGIGIINMQDLEIQFERQDTTFNFQGNSLCHGAQINNIHIVQCSAVCLNPTSALWDIEEFSIIGQLSTECYVFLFNETEEDTGTCTVCFSDHTSHFTLDLTNIEATYLYATTTPAETIWYNLRETMSLVSVGPAGVFALEPTAGGIYYLNNSRGGIVESYQDLIDQESWLNIEGSLTHITVGIDFITGINQGNSIYYRPDVGDSNPTGTGNNWPQITGALKEITMSEHIAQIWGIDTTNGLVYKRGVTSINPQGTTLWIKQYSSVLDVGISAYGIWIILPDNTIKYRVHSGSTLTHSTTSPGWIDVDSDISAKQLSAEGNPEWVVAVDVDGKIYARLGTTASTPTGTSWRRIDFEFGIVEQVSVYKNQIWLTTSENKIYTKTL